MAAAIGPEAAGYACDVADPVSVRACVEAVRLRFGRIDILHNNAATKTADPRKFFTPFEGYPLEVWRDVMSVNIDGMFLMAQAVGREMIRQGSGGTIVQTASIYGLVGPDERIYEGSDYLGGPINSPGGLCGIESGGDWADQVVGDALGESGDSRQLPGSGRCFKRPELGFLGSLC